VSAPDAAKLLDLAVSVAREAGELLASRVGRVEVAATKSSPTDVVTEMDRRSEALIRSRILAERPGDAILGEEEGQTGETDGAPVRWVIDPLDGTVNYLYGLHDWAVSVAAEAARDGAAGGAGTGEAGGLGGRAILAGAVYVPLRGELFSAVRGGGAWLAAGARSGTPAPFAAAAAPADDSPAELVRLRCGPGVPLDRALVGTGFGYLPARRKVQGEVVAALLPRVRDIRRAGVASVDLCSVAAGRLDGYYERGLNYWDYAAGALIAAEAGAAVGGLNGAPISGSMAVAAGPALFGPLSEALAALNPERDA
jgi:myo-inositol-1(or 4)-monophosphatase